MKRKQKIIAIASLLLFFVILYTIGYVHYRKNLYLIHKKSWAGDTIYHKIIRGGPDGPVILVTVLSNGGNMADVENTAKNLSSKINIIYYFYYPCMIAEETIWNIVDRKKLNQSVELTEKPLRDFQ
jgi:hypothetical protein